ncbi:hypothetical protein K466DRAFT_586510 [Polyporus arcularius HHB13444]|uniref:F-box domain-containing protein n=1 Tax=Polyporus arcularius HHB13444 TaxID=1314778 RepID=A0A5C3PMP3_9APHY|nr:hypothetical protein K466DRAFT_586510 [Polyporus arcularius HHB13444]
MHLYADVWLWRLKDFLSFERTLRDRPDLAILVRKLRLHLWPAWELVSDIQAPPLGGDVVARMRNLRKLDIAGFPNLVAADGPPDTRLTAFLGSFSQSSEKITNVTLRVWPFDEYAEILGLSRIFPALQELSLRGVSWASVGRIPSGAALERDNGLRTLALEPTPACFSPQRWNPNMPLGTSSLQRLVFEAPYRKTDQHHYSGLASLSRLVSLYMTFTKEDICLVAAALRHLQSKTIKRLAFFHRCEGQGRDIALDQLRRLRLDELLSVPPYEELTDVFWVVYCKDDSDADGRWTTGIQKHLQGCVRRGILRHRVSASEVLMTILGPQNPTATTEIDEV